MPSKAFAIAGFMAALGVLAGCGGGGGGRSTAPTPNSITSTVHLPMHYTTGGLPRGVAVQGDIVVLTKYMSWVDNRNYADIPQGLSRYSYVSILASDTLLPLADIRVTQAPIDVAVTADGAYAYVVHDSDSADAISKIDLVNQELVNWTSVSSNPIRAILNNDETKLYVLCTGLNRDSEIKVYAGFDAITADTPSPVFTIGDTINLGRCTASAMEINRRHGILYVSCLDGHIFMVDADTDTLITSQATANARAKENLEQGAYQGYHDSDKDGFPDECEIKEGSDPFDYLDQPDDCYQQVDPSAAWIDRRFLPLTDPTQIQITFGANTMVSADYGDPIVLLPETILLESEPEPAIGGYPVGYLWDVNSVTGEVVFTSMVGNRISTPMVHLHMQISETLPFPIRVTGTVPGGIYGDGTRYWDLYLADDPNSSAQYLAVVSDRERDKVGNRDDRMTVYRIRPDGLISTSSRDNDTLVIASNIRSRNVSMRVDGSDRGVVYAGSYDQHFVAYATVYFFEGRNANEIKFKTDSPMFITLDPVHRVWDSQFVGDTLYVSTERSLFTINTR